MLLHLRNVLNCTCNILEANITAHEILNNYNNQKIIVKLEEYLIRYLSSKDLPHEGRRFSGPWCLNGDCCRHRCRSPRPGGSPLGWSAPGYFRRTSSCCQGPSGWGDAKNKPKDHCKENSAISEMSVESLNIRNVCWIVQNTQPWALNPGYYSLNK